MKRSTLVNWPRKFVRKEADKMRNYWIGAHGMLVAYPLASAFD
jgi:hypothetical protein